MHLHEAVALGKVNAQLRVRLVVVEEAIQLDEHWIGLASGLGRTRKDIIGVVAVDEHGEASVSALFPSASAPFYHVPPWSIRSIPGLALPNRTAS
jgi:hypothetical protein